MEGGASGPVPMADDDAPPAVAPLVPPGGAAAERRASMPARVRRASWAPSLIASTIESVLHYSPEPVLKGDLFVQPHET